jgi:hypothetical protein
LTIGVHAAIVTVLASMTTASVDLNILNAPTKKGPESSPAEAGMLY